MNKTSSPQGGPARWHLALQSGLMLALFMLAPNIPRPSVVFPFLLGAASLYYFLAVERGLRGALRATEERWFLAALFGFAGYLFLASLWSLATPAALGKSAFVLSMIGASLLVSRAFSRQSSETLERAAHFAVTGAMIGTLIAGFEFLTDHYLERMVYTTFPEIRPGDKTISVLFLPYGTLVEIVSSGSQEVLRVVSAALNRNLSLLMLLVWPALYLALNHVNPRLRTLCAGIIAVAASATILAGYSQTAQAALLLSAAIFFLARYWPALTHRAVLSAWCVVVMLALPLAAAPYKAGLHKAAWLPCSFRDRVMIWDTTVEQAIKTPWLGIGIRSTRILGKELRTKSQLSGRAAPICSAPMIQTLFGAKKPDARGDDTDKYKCCVTKRLGWHAHNNFLQIWFELGAAGALFLLALGIGLLRAIERMGESVRPYAYAAFVSACTIAAFGWGLWQTWLMSGFALAVMMVRFADACASAHKIEGGRE